MSRLLQEDSYVLLKEDGDALLLEIHYAKADFSGTGTLSGIGRLLAIGKATLSGAGALSAFGRIWKLGAATLAGIGSLAAKATAIFAAKGTLTGVGSLAAAGSYIKSAAATLVGVGSLAAHGILYGLARLKVYISWDGTGNFDGPYDDITNDVKHTTVRRGRSSELGIAEAGTLELRVNDSNGKYSPENITSPLHGLLLPRRQVKFEGSLGGTISIFYGYLEKITPHPQLSEQDTYIYAIDGLDFLSRAEISSTLYKNQLTGVLIGHILDNAGWSATARDINTGQLTVPLGYWQNSNALNAIHELEKSEFEAFAYIDHAGNFKYEDGAFRDAAACAATFNNNYQDLKYTLEAKSIYNEIRVEVRKCELQPQLEIWRLEEEPTIANGVTKTFWASFEDLADSIVTPVATTDYQAWTGAGGTGTDKTADISIVTTKFAQSAKLEVTNNTGVTVYLYLLKLRGELYDMQSSITVKAEDAGVGSSQAKYQKRTLTLASKFLTNVAIAQTYADNALAKYKDPSPDISLTLIATMEGAGDELIHRQISDKIRVINTKLGLDKYFFIEQANYNFSEGGKRQEVIWTLSEV